MTSPTTTNNHVSVPSYGLLMRFTVVVDSQNLGDWASCSGLTVTIDVDQFPEGGNYEYQPYVPTQVKYDKVTLERAMDKNSSAEVQKWLREVVNKWVNSDGTGKPYQGSNVTITLFDSHNSAVASWVLRNAMPIQWTGPGLSSKSNEVATEKLQFIHQGFLR